MVAVLIHFAMEKDGRFNRVFHRVGSSLIRIAVKSARGILLERTYILPSFFRKIGGKLLDVDKIKPHLAD